MKKMVLILLLIIPLAGYSQPGMTPQQQEEFRKQMNDFQLQMEQQMEMLRDSLEQMQQSLKEYEWSEPDPMELELPEMPAEPEMYNFEMFPPGAEVYTDDDSTEVRWGKWKLIVEEGEDGDDHVRVFKDEDCEDDGWDENEVKDLETKFLLLDVGINNYFDENFSSDLPAEYESFEPNPGKSWVVNLHIVNQRLNLVDHHLWLSYGLYFEFNSYKYNHDEVLIPGIDSVAFATNDQPLKKNKLSCEYLGIPLMLRYESNPSDLSNSFHISAGGFGQYLIGAHTKIKTGDGDKAKAHDDFNLNPFRYGLAARVGYSWVSLFVHYGLSELLEKNSGPIVYPFSAGLAFEF